MITDRINILMTGGGAPGAPGILHCLLELPSAHITIADADTEATGKWLAAAHDRVDFTTIPYANDDDFIASVLTACHERSIHIIMPLVTKELLLFAQNNEAFAEAGIKVLVSSAVSLEIANDKGRLYQFLQWRSIAVPGFRIVDTIDQFNEAVSALNYPSSAICFKPCQSNGSRGFRVISSQVDEADLLFNQKPSTTYISLQDAARILSSGSFPELLVSEYLPGDEYSIDCVANKGKPLIIVPRRRLKIINGISVKGEFVINNDIIAYCSSIIHELQLHGNIGIQVKQSAKGEFLILEINPRVQGTISSALGAGVNLPVLAVKQELGLTIKPAELDVKWGTRFSRYWQEVFY